jgi:Oxidoreductase family, NAD-binding Rossmann fold
MLPKIAVFGTNPLASALLSELQRLDFEILGLWDQTLATAVEWCEHFHIPVPSDSIEELLKNQEVDLILVCAPPHFHKEITTKALAAGKHVMCEPPLGLTGTYNQSINQSTNQSINQSTNQSINQLIIHLIDRIFLKINSKMVDRPIVFSIRIFFLEISS